MWPLARKKHKSCVRVKPVSNSSHSLTSVSHGYSSPLQSMQRVERMALAFPRLNLCSKPAHIHVRNSITDRLGC